MITEILLFDFEFFKSVPRKKTRADNSIKLPALFMCLVILKTAYCPKAAICSGLNATL